MPATSSCKALAALLLLLVAAACTPVQPVSVTQHSRIADVASAGTAVAIARQGDSLQEADFNKALAQRLTSAGFTVVEGASDARLIATLKAGVAEGIDKEQVYRYPEYITRSRLITLNDGRQVRDIERIYMGDRVERHRYTIWPATVALTLTDTTTGKPVFEGEVATQGSCGAMAALIGPMLDALFKNLRSESGTVERSYVEVPTC
ncbi:MAG: hypothetical protein P1U65_08370 [Minwuia sp.]|nr:hypothetical protein [Minwuia sp.]